MKRHFILILTLLLSLSACSQQETIITIKTNLGDIEVLLYNETPQHKANMLQLIEEEFYTDQLFHRVINNFMVQGGDPHSKNAPQGQRLGTGGPGYTIEAEFIEGKIHKKGALAAARQGDSVNPEKRSSGSQFYIVQGQVFTFDQLNSLVEAGRHKPFTEEEIRIYTTIGGTPHLDDSYTVFGEVVKGLEVVDKIASSSTDSYDRPIEDIIYNIKVN
jgi:peptidyl-prolyl cis-trans isomerase B (cyclophilin B)